MMQQLQTEAEANHTVNNYAAQIRVTPDELTEAVTRIEMRNAAVTNEAANSLSLGEAVEQLHLNMSPEELLEEVRTLRESREAQAATQTADASVSVAVNTAQKRHARRFLALVTVMCAGSLVVSLGLWMNFLRRLQPTPSWNQATPHDYYPQRPIDYVADDDVFTMTIADVIQLAEKREMHPTISTSPTVQPDEAFAWRMQKWRGKTFVLGWAAKETSDATLKSGSFALSNVIDATQKGEFKRVKVPIERFADIPEPPSHQKIRGVDAQTLQIPAAK